MAVYFVTGTLGCGKTLCCVGKIRDYLAQGRKVATNLDINMREIASEDSRGNLVRLPDKPQLSDLESIGIGCEESNENKYGLLVLDELGTWFNSRKWQDKTRLDVINWFLHARKLHWDVYLIVQNVDSLDQQLVQALCEHLVVCKRTDRLPIPFIGKFLKLFSDKIKLPKIHIAKVYYGKTDQALLVDKWWYRARDLYSAYNTDQIFSEESDAVHSLLPAYYLNNLALIQHHKQQVERFSKSVARPAPTGLGGLRLGIGLATFACIALISYRTYAKLQPTENLSNNTTTKQETIISTEKPKLSIEPAKSYIPPKPKDYIEELTTGAQLVISSFYSYEAKINAVLHVIKGEDDTSITLDDIRAAGYVTTTQNGYLYASNQHYNFAVKIPH